MVTSFRINPDIFKMIKSFQVICPEWLLDWSDNIINKDVTGSVTSFADLFKSEIT